MPEEASHPVTLGEVSRDLNRFRAEIRDGLLSVHQRLDRVMDRVVTSDVYAADKTANGIIFREIRKDLEEMKAQEEKREERRHADRRLIMFSLIWPTVLVLISVGVSVYLAAK